MVACSVGLPASAAQSALPKIAEGDIPNFARVDDNVYRGGMPSYEGLRQLKEAGVRTIVSLANEKKYVEGERAAAEQLGMHFVFIPLSAWKGPKQNDIDAFLALMQNSKDSGKVFVHCMHGQDRTGAMIAMYRMRHDGWSEKKAYDEMLDNGFHRMFFKMADRVKDFQDETP